MAWNQYSLRTAEGEGYMYVVKRYLKNHLLALESTLLMRCACGVLLTSEGSHCVYYILHEYVYIVSSLSTNTSAVKPSKLL